MLITWVFFRAENFEVATRYLGSMFGFGGGAESSELLTATVLRPMNWLFFALCVAWTWWLPRTAVWLEKLTRYKVVLGIGLLVFSLALMFNQGFNPFLYFQF